MHDYFYSSFEECCINKSNVALTIFGYITKDFLLANSVFRSYLKEIWPIVLSYMVLNLFPKNWKQIIFVEVFLFENINSYCLIIFKINHNLIDI